MKHRRGQVYVRRLRKTDKADSLLTAFKLAYLEISGGGYGVFRHGRPHIVLHAEKTKRECKNSFFGGWKNAKKFFRQRKGSLRTR